MKQVITTAKAVASTDSSVMLVGSSGTGKDVIARYIHRHSLRAERALVPVNCAAIPAELMESEFFGYVKGAFTGANPEGKAGLFELADRGTLFLDEIGDLPLGMQTKLLRVLETGEVTRLGATKPITVDVRLISATNRDLQELIKNKQFRSDLYFRINVIPITLSNLKDRPEDILPLADGILNELNKRYGQNKVLTEQTKEKLLSYDWPGNVRELRNVVERMLITQLSDELVLDDNYLESGDGSTAISEYPVIPIIPTGDGSLKSVMAQAEKAYIKRALDAANGNVAKAAETLEIHRSILYRKIAAYNIENK
jgi:transcriptional regulator with PAS, ATPase and Fis domain